MPYSNRPIFQNLSVIYNKKLNKLLLELESTTVQLTNYNKKMELFKKENMVDDIRELSLNITYIQWKEYTILNSINKIKNKMNLVNTMLESLELDISELCMSNNHIWNSFKQKSLDSPLAIFINIYSFLLEDLHYAN